MKTTPRYVYATYFRIPRTKTFVRLPRWLGGYLSRVRYFRRNSRFSAAPAPHKFAFAFHDENL